MLKRLLPPLLCLLAAGCINFKNAGKDATGGALDAIRDNRDGIAAITGQIVQTIRDTALGPQTRIRLAEILDELGVSLIRQSTTLRDSIIGEYTLLWAARMRDELLGASTQVQLARIRDEMIGPQTNAHLARIRDDLLGDRTRFLVAGIRDDLIGDTTVERLAAIRSELLGAVTRAALDSITTGVIASVAEGIRTKIQPIVREEGDNLEKFLIAAGVVIAGLIVLAGIVFMQKRQRERMLDVVTSQIAAIPNPAVRERLKTGIHAQAVTTGVEPQLREFLEKRGMLHREAAGTPEVALSTGGESV